MPLLRFSAVTALTLCAVLPSAADLVVPLQGKTASRPKPAASAGTAPAPAAKPVAPAQPGSPPVIRGTLGSRSLPRQVGVARRGSAPVLPPVSAAPEPEPLAPPMEVSARLGKMLAPQTDVFRLPDARSQWVGRLKRDQQVAIVSQWSGWFAIVMQDGSHAYVPQTHVEVLPYAVKTVIPELPTGNVPDDAPGRPSAQNTGWDPYEAPRTELARRILTEAFEYRGVPYVWGGNTKSGLDCSGFVKTCLSACGISLPRRASEQATVGDDVPLNQLQPGDRLYFSVKRRHDHTGLYLGNGYFIHAGRSRGNVGVDHLSMPLYSRSLASARRF